MTTSKIQTSMHMAIAVAVLLSVGATAQAQCNTCAQPVYAAAPVAQPMVAQPTVAFSPVVPSAPSPVVYQTYRPYSGWYPGKYLARAITWPFRDRTTVAPVGVAPVATAPLATPTSTFVTAAYRPTYPLTYTASYAPTVQTLARPVTLTALSPCGCGPVCGCTSPCSTCATGGVTTAGFESGYNGGCSNCAAATFDARAATSAPLQPTPAPALSPNAAVPEQRVNRPNFEKFNQGPAEVSPNDDSVLRTNGIESPAGPDAAESSWWDAPELFDARDRSAQRHRSQQPTAPVWNAVYHKTAARTVQQAGYRSNPTPAPVAKRNVQVGASGWQAAP